MWARRARGKNKKGHAVPERAPWKRTLIIDDGADMVLSETSDVTKSTDVSHEAGDEISLICSESESDTDTEAAFELEDSLYDVRSHLAECMGNLV